MTLDGGMDHLKEDCKPPDLEASLLGYGTRGEADERNTVKNSEKTAAEQRCGSGQRTSSSSHTSLHSDDWDWRQLALSRLSLGTPLPSACLGNVRGARVRHSGDAWGLRLQELGDGGQQLVPREWLDQERTSDG